MSFVIRHTQGSEKQATSFVIIERLGQGGFSYIRVKTKC
ncbi:hypothetical protein MC7420_4375 [Coleofasciculus chthonoplastes PCC 7420]|uniref:Uncharacterized protein n=1 Tax=Coleofasciculus chthonoplastes PCC 7420 TaxID=118168 RepID=B4VXX1_9CYAN|nr:hypothetical protein MC7420_4375 [Coleofasciculus chthonoplastes PCC 7420]